MPHQRACKPLAPVLGGEGGGRKRFQEEGMDWRAFDGKSRGIPLQHPANYGTNGFARMPAGRTRCSRPPPAVLPCGVRPAMTTRTGSLPSLLLIAWLCHPLHAESFVVKVSADPASLRLAGPVASYSLLIRGQLANGQAIDLTPTAHYESADAHVAAVSGGGRVRGVADGATTVTVTAAGQTLSVPVIVTGSSRPRRFNFENDVIPLLSKFGCNSSGCHGKAEGQNGFKLSVFGFDPAADFAALTKEGRGRRVFVASPEHSLVLAKAAGRVPHGGGTRIPHGSAEYETLRGWIAAGLPYGEPGDPKVVSIRVEPRERVLAMHGQQQLRAIAHYSDGRDADVTPHAKFQSNNDGLAVVDGHGLVTAGESPGDVAVMASFMSQVDVFRALIPRSEAVTHYPELPANNFIDPLVLGKLRSLNIVPSDLADDAEFLRRVYLDVIGTLPTADEARRFFGETRLDRRARLVDELVQRPEFADYWALKWADLLRVDRQALGHKDAYHYYKWLHDSFATNKRLDQLVRDLLTAEGRLQECGPASFYKVVAKPGDTASTLAQVFLGIRLACAQCHHHPFDRWSQSDYYGMEAFFTQVSIRPTPGGEVLLANGEALTRHPRTGEIIYAHPLGMELPKASPAGDRRAQLADWLTAGSNAWFARNLANRTWAHFLGRGLVEPVDDLRATNPPTNPELLDALARSLVESHYDFRQLIRTITASRVYQLSSKPNPTNECDEQNYSRALLKRPDAEVLLDMVCQSTGVGEKFPGVPAGERAIQLWDSKVSHYFLKLFGRPMRVTACECERNHEPSVSQVLHILNSPEIQAKLSHEGGTVARLVRSKTDDAALVEELYLTFYSRLPNELERQTAVAYLHRDPARRQQAAEDVAWSMLNSLEFVFNH